MRLCKRMAKHDPRFSRAAWATSGTVDAPDTEKRMLRNIPEKLLSLTKEWAVSSEHQQRNSRLRLRFQRMLRLLEELVLQPQAGLIRFHRPNRRHNRFLPFIHFKLAPLFGSRRSVSRIVIGESGIPP